MVLKTWPPINRGVLGYVAPELLPFLANRNNVNNSNNIIPESPLSWTGVEDEPLTIDSDEENSEQVHNTFVYYSFILIY